VLLDGHAIAELYVHDGMVSVVHSVNTLDYCVYVSAMPDCQFSKPERMSISTYLYFKQLIVFVLNHGVFLLKVSYSQFCLL